jgi:hypothetical protein
MRLFKTITQTIFFLFTSTILLAQTTIKEKDYTLKYSTTKIGIQFENTTTEIKAFDAFTNNTNGLYFIQLQNQSQSTTFKIVKK